MKEFIEKLIGRLEEERKKHISEYGLIDMQVQEVFVNVRKIVNQLAEEYKSRIMIDEEYCWQKCSAVENCSECNRLENGTIDYFENYDSLVGKYNNGCDDKKTKNDELENNFKIIYDSYPKKVGKSKGYEYYLGWLKGRKISGRTIRLTNKQIWQAIANYKREIDKNETELQFIKQFDTFMNKSILDYIED